MSFNPAASFEKKDKPGFPVAFLSNVLQEIVIFLAMSFEIETEIEHRLGKRLLGAKEQGNHQATQTAVSIEKRVDGFELHMRESGFQE